MPWTWRLSTPPCPLRKMPSCRLHIGRRISARKPLRWLFCNLMGMKSLEKLTMYVCNAHEGSFIRNWGKDFHPWLSTPTRALSHLHHFIIYHRRKYPLQLISHVYFQQQASGCDPRWRSRCTLGGGGEDFQSHDHLESLQLAIGYSRSPKPDKHEPS